MALKVQITGSDDSKAAFDSVKSNLIGTAQVAEQGTSAVSDFFGGMLQHATAIISTNILGNIWGQLSGLTNTLAQGAIADQDSMAKLDFQLMKLGPDAALTKDQLMKLADSLSVAAGGSADFVVEAEAALLKLKVQKDVFPQATKLSLDLAKVMGVDVAQAASMMGKALLEPGAGLRRLEIAAGVTFPDAVKKQIKAMTDAGDVAGAQKVILDALQGSIGGAANALNNTLGSKLKILQEQFTDIGESIIDKVTPAITGLLDKAGPYIIKFQDYLKNLVDAPAITEALDEVTDAVDSFFSFLDAGFDPLYAFEQTLLRIVPPEAKGLVEGIYTVINNLIQSIQLFPDDPLGALTNFLYTLGADDLADNILGFADALSSLVEYFAAILDDGDYLNDWLTHLPEPIQGATEAVGELVSMFIDDWPKIQQAVSDTITFVQNEFAQFFPTLVSSSSTGLGSLRDIWKEHGDTIIATVKLLFEGAVVVVMGTIDLIVGVVSAGLQLLSGIMDAASLIFQGNWQGAWDRISEATQDALSTLGSVMYDILKGALDLVGVSVDDFISTWKGNWDLLVIITEALWKKLQDAYSAWIMLLTSKTQAWVISVVNTIRGFADSFYNAGTWIMDNVLRGIMQKASQIIGAVVGVVKDSINAAGNALGMINPGGSSKPGSKGFASGGISTGPASGHMELLHGTEAIIPLGDGNKIPIEFAAPAMGGGQVPLQFVYAPMMSFADKFEAENRLRPIIEDALRRIKQ